MKKLLIIGLMLIAGSAASMADITTTNTNAFLLIKKLQKERAERAEREAAKDKKIKAIKKAINVEFEKLSLIERTLTEKFISALNEENYEELSSLNDLFHELERSIIREMAIIKNVLKQADSRNIGLLSQRRSYTQMRTDISYNMKLLSIAQDMICIVKIK